jgi:pimeloyl-ACP methyl ester carboxylesterase
MAMLELPDASLHYVDEGAGPPLVLLHANPGDHRDFDAIRPWLRVRCRVLALDWPGYGASPAPADPRASSAMRCAGLLRQFVEALELPPVILLGNSVGGYAAVRLALDAPERVRALALVSPGGFTPHNALTRAFCRLKGTEAFTRFSNPWFARLYLRRRNRWVAEILERAAGEQSGAEQVSINAATWRSFVAPEHDLRAAASKLKLPTWLAFGRHDPLIPASRDGATAAASLPGAEFQVFDTGHMPFAEAPDAFMARLAPFLDRVTDAA